MTVLRIPPVPLAGSKILSIIPLSLILGLTNYTSNYLTLVGVKNYPNSDFLLPPAPKTASTNIFS